MTGLKVAHRYPEKIHAYVGIGQIIDDYEKEKIGYNFIVNKANESGDDKVQNKIRTLGPPPYAVPEKRLEKARYIVQFGGFIHDKPIMKMISAQLTFLTSPEYTFLEGFRTFQNRGLKSTMGAMWVEIKSINLKDEIESLNVPIYFFQGKYDMITPTTPIENFYNNLDAKTRKKLIIFENSAHVPFLEEREKYQEVLIEVVLKESQNK